MFNGGFAAGITGSRRTRPTAARRGKRIGYRTSNECNNNSKSLPETGRWSQVETGRDESMGDGVIRQRFLAANFGRSSPRLAGRIADGQLVR